MRTAQITTAEGEEGRGRNEKSCELEFPRCPPTPRATGELWSPGEGRVDRATYFLTFSISVACPHLELGMLQCGSQCVQHKYHYLPFNDLKGKMRREIRHIHL